LKKIANFGAGVNSVAGILHYGAAGYDEIIFADTGSEKPETYQYLDFLIKEKGWKITIIKSKLGNLYDYYFKKKLYPLRFNRDCTGKFKITPIKQYLRTKYGKKETFQNDIFIDYSEFHRMKTSDVKYQTLEYPLVYDKIDREECLSIIKDAGYPIPVKSGCFMCPFNSKKIWTNLKVQHPELFAKALKMEKNDKRWKEMPLILLKGKESQDLFQCDCF
jgi:hypothetical protein